MEWLCCFVKDRVCAGIIDRLVCVQQRKELIDKPLVHMCGVSFFLLTTSEHLILASESQDIR